MSPSKRSLYPLLAFVVPLLLRTIPEVLMGPYVVGFDTMGHYIPTTVLWMHGGVSLGRYIATAPLFYSILVLFAYVSVPVVAALKVLPVVLHGLLGLSIFGYSNRSLKWSPKKSLFTALLGTAYFVALRISWDLLRNELALVLFFVVLTLLHDEGTSKYSWKRYAAISLAMVSVVLAQQLVAVLMFGVVVITVVYRLLPKRRAKILPLIAASIPALALFFVGLAFNPSVPEHRIIFGFPSGNDGWLALFGFASYPAMLASEAGFFLYCFLLILPFVVVSLRRFRDFQMRSFVVLILIASLIPMVSPSNLRWIMMLIYPFAFYVTETFSRLSAFKWRRIGLNVKRIALIYLVVSTAAVSLSFMVMPPEAPSAYFIEGGINGYIYQIPSSMLQNTISVKDCKDTSSTLEYFKANITGEALLLTHRAFYGWAMSTLNPTQVFLYEYDNPLTTAQTVSQQVRSPLYLVWWVNGSGWHGQPNVPAAFDEVFHSGEIALYQYAPK
jgi:hypothetical protein